MGKPDFPDSPRSPRGATISAGRPLEPVTVVLIENDEDNASLVAELAANPAFHVLTAETIGLARQILAEHSVDCAILDLHLPDAKGLEVLEEVRWTYPDLPIVVISDLSDESMVSTAVQRGAQDYLVKTQVDARLLAQSIRYAIERRHVELKLARQALYDPLTGLPNRTLFLDRLKGMLARARRHHSLSAVLFCDLDSFKWINDSLGHDVGDRLLTAVAERLSAALRPEDTVARFGGDEFVILCEALSGEAQAMAVAKRIGDAVSETIKLDGREHHLSTSIGIAFARDGSLSSDELLRDADAAMYRAKRKGKGCYEVFDEVMRARAVERLEQEAALRRALEKGEFRVAYQPTVSLRTGRITGFEALLRWQDPVRGLLSAEQLLPLAEETGIIVPLGGWVLREACLQAREWDDRFGGASGLTMSVNVSPRQLSQLGLVEVVNATLADTGLPPERLVLEITESAFVEDPEPTVAALRAIKSLGVGIAIDDFGTGFSSLSYLKRFPVDVLKIDRSFVEGLGRDRHDSTIVASMVTLAEGLGLTSTGEGVETPTQLTQLRMLGCDLAQGFHLARPQLPAAIERLLEQGGTVSDAQPGGLDLMVEPPSRLPAGAPNAMITVVLADDTSELRLLLRLSLRRTRRFEVVGEAADGAMAISVVEASHPDAIVLDLAMPVMDGLQAIPEIRRRSPGTKIIVLSGFAASEMKREAMALGADAYLEKGQAPSVLAGTLTALCGR